MKSFWQSVNEINAGDAILSGYQGSLEDMPVYDEVMELVGSGNSALDFGCGVGRNSYAMAEKFDKVVGFDLPNMLNIVPEKNKLSNIHYESNWDIVKQNKFDVALASLVFQHIEDVELNNYLADLQQITDKMVLHSRTWIDHSHTWVLPTVEKYFIIETLKYNQDPNNASHDHFLATMKTRG